MLSLCGVCEVFSCETELRLCWVELSWGGVGVLTIFVFIYIKNLEMLVKNGRMAAVVRASPKLTENRQKLIIFRGEVPSRDGKSE